MRVAYFTNRYPAISHTFIRREIRALEAEGAAVTRIALRADPVTNLADKDDRDERERTQILFEGSRLSLVGKMLRALARRPARALGTLAWAIGFDRHARIGLGKMLGYWSEALILVDLLRGQEALRVHFGTNGAIVARLTRRLGGPPFSIAYHGPDEFDAPQRWDISGTIAESAFVTAISHYCSAQLMRWSDPSVWSRIHIVRCSVDEQFFEGRPIEAQIRRMCTVARLAPQKGLALLLDALGQILAEGGTPPRLDIIGEGPLRASLEEQSAQLGLTGHVHFLGARDGAGVRAALADAQCFILPSFAEGLPVVIMEAMAAGRPVIATAIAAVGELVANGRNGWLIDAGDRDAIVAAIRAAQAASAETVRALSEQAQADVRARHLSSCNARILAGILERQASAVKVK